MTTRLSDKLKKQSSLRFIFSIIYLHRNAWKLISRKVVSCALSSVIRAGNIYFEAPATPPPITTQTIHNIQYRSNSSTCHYTKFIKTCDCCMTVTFLYTFSNVINIFFGLNEAELCPDKSLYTLLTARMLTLSSASISGYFLFLISQMSPPQPLSPVNKTLFITTPAPNPVPNVIPIKFFIFPAATS